MSVLSSPEYGKEVSVISRKKSKKREIILTVIAIAVLFVAYSMTQIKVKLCDGVYFYQYQYRNVIFDVYIGTETYTYVYEFHSDNTYTIYEACWDTSGYNDHDFEEFDKGTYKVDIVNSKIITVSDSGHTEEYPYAINVFNRSLVFDPENDGTSEYRHANSVENIGYRHSYS